MKVAVVSSAVIAREGRLDAEYYLGREQELVEKVVAAEQNLERAKARLANAKANHEAEVRRMQQINRD